jgi:hypothetical protein
MLTYTIWAVNCSSSTSAFNINMTDRLPDNVMMMMSLPGWNGNSGGSWWAASGSNNTTWTASLPAYGQGPPYYLRFVLDLLGPARSGFVSYVVTVR